jgi:WhiB family redox-sensing transcriptional regulator
VSTVEELVPLEDVLAAARDEDPDAPWQKFALCKHFPSVDFFPLDGLGVVLARRVCAECPVRLECLEHALTRPELHGVWGGMSERERVRFKRDGGLTRLALGRVP